MRHLNRLTFIALLALVIISCGENTDKKNKVNGGDDVNDVSDVEIPVDNDTAEYMTDQFVLSDKMTLQVELPNYKCPSNINKRNFCFHSANNKKVNLLLDPGHSLSLDSARNGRHDEIHEGYLNMVVATLVKHYLKKCFSYERKEKTGVKNDQVYFSYYPGEKNYGEFLLGTPLTEGNKIIAKATNRRLAHINKLFSKTGQTSKSVVVSIHADAPDYASDTNRMTEFPYVIYRKIRSASKSLAKNIYKSLVTQMGPYFLDSQQSKFKIENLSNNTYLYPQMFKAGEKDLPNYSFIQEKIGNEQITYRTRTSPVLWEMRSGNSETEAILIEGFFMDSLGLGQNIQTELKNDEAPRAYFTLIKNGVEEELKFPSFNLKITGKKEGRISYRTTKVKDELGLKISKVYNKYALSIVKGLQSSYSCL